MAKLMVGILQAPTHKAKFQSFDNETRLKLAIQAVGKLYARAFDQTNRHDLGIFVAPEYFFSRKNANQPVQQAGGGKYYSRGIDENDKEENLETFKELTAKLTHPTGKLLLIPGTMAWLKPFDREKGIARHRAAEKEKRSPGKALPDRGAKAAHDLDYAALKRGRQIYRGHTHHPANDMRYAQWGAETGFVGGNAYGNRPVPKTDAKRDLITNRQDQVQILRNSLYVISGGQVLHKYNKVADYHEVLDMDDQPSVFVPGDMERQTKELFGKRFGFEICLDHDLDILGFGRGKPIKEAVDFQILLSAKVDTKQAYLKDGGIFIHASSDKHQTGVLRKLNGQMDWVGEATDLNDILDGDCTMRYFRTEANIAVK
jgi:hypothetical protein